MTAAKGPDAEGSELWSCSTLGTRARHRSAPPVLLELRCSSVARHRGTLLLLDLDLLQAKQQSRSPWPPCIGFVFCFDSAAARPPRLPAQLAEREEEDLGEYSGRNLGGKAILPAPASARDPAAVVYPQQLPTTSTESSGRLGARALVVDERSDGTPCRSVAGGAFCKIVVHVDSSRRGVVRALKPFPTLPTCRIVSIALIRLSHRILCLCVAIINKSENEKRKKLGLA